MSRPRRTGTGAATGETEAERRAALRRFVRENHPDRGGDPDAFTAGLAALRALDSVHGGGAAAPGGVRFHRRRGPLETVVDRVRRLAAPARPPRVR